MVVIANQVLGSSHTLSNGMIPERKNVGQTRKNPPLRWIDVQWVINLNARLLGVPEVSSRYIGGPFFINL